MLEEEPNQHETRLAPAMLFRSFLIVAGAYLANLVLLSLVTFVFFPETIEIIGKEPAEFQKIVDDDPQKIFPPQLFWVLLVASSVTCSVLGYLVARLAPIGKFSHAIFFAAILFVQYLQLSIGAERDLRTKLVLMMVVSSVAVLIGANTYLKSISSNLAEES